jgi:hypothetical protein
LKRSERSSKHFEIVRIAHPSHVPAVADATSSVKARAVLPSMVM